MDYDLDDSIDYYIYDGVITYYRKDLPITINNGFTKRMYAIRQFIYDMETTFRYRKIHLNKTPKAVIDYALRYGLPVLATRTGRVVENLAEYEFIEGHDFKQDDFYNEFKNPPAVIKAF